MSIEDLYEPGPDEPPGAMAARSRALLVAAALLAVLGLTATAVALSGFDEPGDREEALATAPTSSPTPSPSLAPAPPPR